MFGEWFVLNKLGFLNKKIEKNNEFSMNISDDIGFSAKVSIRLTNNLENSLLIRIFLHKVVFEHINIFVGATISALIIIIIGVVFFNFGECNKWRKH